MELAAQQLTQADRLGASARHDAGWYVAYLGVFGLASFALAGVFAFAGGVTAVAVTTPLWVVFVGISSWWAATRRVTMRGYTSLHMMVMVAWGVVWVATVLIGTSLFPQVWQWWIGGGLAMAAVAWTGAVIAYRRSRP